MEYMVGNTVFDRMSDDIPPHENFEYGKHHSNAIL